MTTYALDIAGQVGEYPVIDDFARALHAAYDELRIRGNDGTDSVTVLRVEGEGDALAFTPLVTLVPPAAPKESHE